MVLPAACWLLRGNLTLIKQASAVEVDFSFKGLTEMTDVLDETARGDKPRPVDQEIKPVAATTLKLNNNALSSMAGLGAMLSKVLTAPLELSFLDLSCNSLKCIDPALAGYPKLSILYLHGNQLERLKEVTRLTPLVNLKSLTLHGNDVEKEKDYRLFVVHALPQIRKLDFCAITPGDRETAARTGGGGARKKIPAGSISIGTPVVK